MIRLSYQSPQKSRFSFLVRPSYFYTRCSLLRPTMLGHTLVSARQLIVLQKHSLHYVPIRHASLNSAIERGLRKSRNAEDFAPKRYRDNDRYDSRPRDTKLWNDRKEDRSDVERPGVRWSRKTDDSAPKRYHNNDRHSKTQRSSKPRKREEEETPTEADYFDEDEFIRTGLFPSVIRFRGGPTVSKGKTMSPILHVSQILIYSSH